MEALILLNFAHKAGSSITWRTCIRNTNQRLRGFSFIQLKITVHHWIQA